MHLLTDGAGHDEAPAAGSAATHVDQSVLTVVAADTAQGLQVRTRKRMSALWFSCVLLHMAWVVSIWLTRQLSRCITWHAVGVALRDSSAAGSAMPGADRLSFSNPTHAPNRTSLLL